MHAFVAGIQYVYRKVRIHVIQNSAGPHGLDEASRASPMSHILAVRTPTAEMFERAFDTFEVLQEPKNSVLATKKRHSRER
jgi:hypothetical protein